MICKALLVLITVPLSALAQKKVTFQTPVFIGNYTPNPNDQTVRDLGFSGKIRSTVINSFGDTITCSNAYYQTGCSGLSLRANSAGIGLSATRYKDTPNPQSAEMFCKFMSSETPADSYGMDITNVVPTSSTTGVLYFLAIRRNIANNPNPPAVGAGIAKITFGGSGNPICTRLSEHVWNGLTEPWYGDHSAFLGAAGDYIHAVGGANTTNAGGNYLFITRVPFGSATDVSAYQYWNGKAWQTGRITAGKTSVIKLTPHSPHSCSAYTDRGNQSLSAALVDVNGTPITDQGQGQIMYNKYLGQYIYLDRNGFDFNIRIRTASEAQGPWSVPQDLFGDGIGGCKSYGYSPTIEPWWYASDQTIAVIFTCVPNILQSVKVVSCSLLRALSPTTKRDWG